MKMIEKCIETSLGKITIYLSERPKTIPLVFLHGVYLDHSIWKQTVSDELLLKHTIVLIDMPMHGNSKLVNQSWDMNSCVDMFFEILDGLGFERVIAIGHSWGSMTILRAASIDPDRFDKLILFNMPYKALTITSRLIIRLRHLMLVFPQFYYEQVGKALMSKESLKKNRFLMKNFIEMISGLKRHEIVKTDKEVLVDAVNTLQLINDLSVPHIIVKGKDDYVPLPPNSKTMIIPGGHLSPMEVPDEVRRIIKLNLYK